MRIGVPKEIKTAEYRVGLTPASVRELAGAGHQVMVETGAGAGIDFADQAYIEAGATIAATARAVFEAADLIVKVKEPQAAERAMLRPGQILFTYLHLAADRKQTEDLIASGAACIAYETVTDEGGGLPLLRPMSEVAGRMSIQVGARFLEEPQGGRGILLGGAPGVERGHIVILGGGVAGVNAAQIGMGMHADVSVFDISAERLAQIDAQFDGQVRTLFSTAAAIEEALPLADLVIGAVLVPGAEAPRLVRRADLKRMRKGSVLVDIAIDQGGCFETSHPTTHDNPTFVVEGVIHYCVANMPGAVPRTSTLALNNVTLPFVKALARDGLEALKADPHLSAGLNVFEGKIVHPAVAAVFPDLPTMP